MTVNGGVVVVFGPAFCCVRLTGGFIAHGAVPLPGGFLEEGRGRIDAGGREVGGGMDRDSSWPTAPEAPAPGGRQLPIPALSEKSFVEGAMARVAVAA